MRQATEVREMNTDEIYQKSNTSRSKIMVPSIDSINADCRWFVFKGLEAAE
jgi:hypothetical protein